MSRYNQCFLSLIEGFGGKRALGFLLKRELCQKRSKFRMQFCLRVSNNVLHVLSCPAERDRNACREGSVTPRARVNMADDDTRKSLKAVLTFQTLMLATLGKWATTHDRVLFLGKNCSWTLLPGST